MKKTTFLILFIISTTIYGQSFSTGTIQLGGSNRTVSFDIDTSSGTVTMTMNFPNNSYLAIGLSQGTENDIALGQSMGDLDDDCIVGLSSGIQDRNMPSGTGTPQLDNSGDMDDEWTVTSNTVSGSVRTIVATRAINTSDSEDTIFPSSATAFPLIYAFGGASFGYHGAGNYGAAMANLTLSTDSLDKPFDFKLYPNPSSDSFTVDFDKFVEEASIEVYSILGNRILQQNIASNGNAIEVNNWKPGIYLVKISNNQGSETKRFVKQ